MNLDPKTQTETRSPLALEAREVWKAFERTQALSGVSFELRPGEIHALVGANGAGKSTFSRIVSGHLPADRAEIHLFGEPARFASAREAIRAGITMVMQETSLAPDLSVLENTSTCRSSAPPADSPGGGSPRARIPCSTNSASVGIYRCVDPCVNSLPASVRWSRS
jgi:ABC-type multidrug transport system ATPase subunit